MHLVPAFLAQRLRLAYGLALILLSISGLYNLDRDPRLWWDEGWTLSVARNWVERGHYGQFLDREPQPPGLTAAFPVVLPVALSFKLFGLGIWQGRLPGVLFTIGSLALLYYLAGQLYNRAIAAITLLILLLGNLHEHLNPIIIGRQVLGEMPAVFFLLAGYTLFYLAFKKNTLFILWSVLMWGLALLTKAQVAPFWLFSLLVPLCLATYHRKWRILFLITFALVGSWIVSIGLLKFQPYLTGVPSGSSNSIEGIYQITTLAFTWEVRRTALLVIILFGLPTLIGLIYSAYKLVREGINRSFYDSEMVKIAFLALGSSWYGWYALLAMFWPRYFFPAIFFSAIFTALLIFDLTGGLNISATVSKASSIILTRSGDRGKVSAMLAVILIGLVVAVPLLQVRFAGNSIYGSLEIVDYIELKIPSDALIETYESELFFLLPYHRFHFPPDQVSVDLVRRENLQPGSKVDYDPMAANPDYLISGPFSEVWNLYTQVLTSGSFQMVERFPPYTIYQREVR